MSDQYLGEIRMFTGNYAPKDWALCNGALLSVSEYNALFSLIGTTYGGDGEETFALPDLRGRLPIHAGTSGAGTVYQLGDAGGTETETLSLSQVPAHTHPVNANRISNQASPANGFWGDSTGVTNYQPNGTVGGSMNSSLVSSVGGGNPEHDNVMPYLPINFIIALTGIYPSPT